MLAPYSATIGFTFLGAIMDVVPVLPVFRAVFTGPALVVETIMTCNVFRAVVLGYIVDVKTILPMLTTVIETYDSTLGIECEFDAGNDSSGGVIREGV